GRRSGQATALLITDELSLVQRALLGGAGRVWLAHRALDSGASRRRDRDGDRDPVPHRARLEDHAAAGLKLQERAGREHGEDWRFGKAELAVIWVRGPSWRPYGPFAALAERRVVPDVPHCLQVSARPAATAGV